MAGSNSHMWILVMAGVLIILLALGMNMLVEMKPMVQELQTLSLQTRAAFPGSELSYRLEPPEGQELAQGEERTNGLVLHMQVSPAVLQDPAASAQQVREAQQVLIRGMMFLDQINSTMNWYEVVLEAGTEEPVAPVVQRFPYVPRQTRGSFQQAPDGPEGPTSQPHEGER